MNTMTETEARERWCPMARVLESHAEKASYNRIDKHNVTEPHFRSVACIGSACMAWRWVPATGHISEIVRQETGLGWIEWIKAHRVETNASLHETKRELERRFGGRSVQSKSGYCGAFGKPE